LSGSRRNALEREFPDRALPTGKSQSRKDFYSHPRPTAAFNQITDLDIYLADHTLIVHLTTTNLPSGADPQRGQRCFIGWFPLSDKSRWLLAIIFSDAAQPTFLSPRICNHDRGATRSAPNAIDRLPQWIAQGELFAQALSRVA